MNLLIDGYNLMFQYNGAELAKKSNVGQLQTARRQMLRFLATHLSAIWRAGCTVVFDTQRHRPAAIASDQDFGMEVIYAYAYESADDWLIERIQSISTPQRLIVVSSDRQVQVAARRRRAMVIPCETFIDQLESGQWRESAVDEPLTDVTADEKPTLHEFDVHYWREFLGLDEDANGTG